jgi:hypothetical protein
MAGLLSRIDRHFGCDGYWRRASRRKDEGLVFGLFGSFASCHFDRRHFHSITDDSELWPERAH